MLVGRASDAAVTEAPTSSLVDTFRAPHDDATQDNEEEEEESSSDGDEESGKRRTMMRMRHDR